MAAILSSRPDALPVDIYALDLPIQYQVRNSDQFNVGAGGVTAQKGPGTFQTAGSTILTVRGSGFAYGADDGNPDTADGPTAGSISSAWIYFDDIATAPPASTIVSPQTQTVFHVALPTPVAVQPGMFADKNIFFSTLLSGDDVASITVLALQKFAADGLNVTAAAFPLPVRGGNDQLTITGTAEAFFADPGTYRGQHDYSGDFIEIGVGTTVTGGNDVIVYSGPTIMMPIYGDAETVRGALTGGDDHITLTNAVFNNIPSGLTGVPAYGDARTIAAAPAGGGSAGSVIGGKDTILGSAFGDIISGDVSRVEAGARLRPGNDFLLGFGGSDTIYGDYETLAEGAIVEAGGDDWLIGGLGPDKMLGQGGNDGFRIDDQIEHPVVETIDGGDGTDFILFSPTSAGQTLVLAPSVSNIEQVWLRDSNFGLTTIAINLDASAVTLKGLEILGNDGANTVIGTNFADTLVGFGGADVLRGGGGGDLLFGDAGADNLFGDAGNDRIVWNNGDGSDVIEGGGDSDTLEVNGSDAASDNFTLLANAGRIALQRVNLTPFALDVGGVEAIVLNLGGGDDTVDGTGLGDSIGLSVDGGSGNDRATGSALADTLSGGDNNDSLTGSLGADSLDGGNGDDLLEGGSGSDTLNGGVGNDRLFASTEATPDGSGSAEIMNGGIGDDTLRGANGADTLSPGLGADSVNGGAGVDTLVLANAVAGIGGFDGADLVSFVAGTATRQIAIALNQTTGGFVTTPQVTTFANIEAVRAGDGADTVLGSAAANQLFGEVGADELIGDGPLSLTAAAQSIRRLYIATLDRGPDDAGWQGWTAAREAGRTLDSIAEGFVGSSEFQTKYGALDNTAFVTLLYQNVLDRNPDAGGLSAYTVALTTGQLTRTAMVVQFSESAEFRAGTAPELHAGQIFRLYGATLARAPDAVGFEGWTDQLGGGRGLVDIAGGFVGSSEFQATYGALDDAGFVTLLYQNVLGRAPDQTGLAFWSGQLASNAQSRTQVVTGFSESAEYIAGTRSAVDGFMRNTMTVWSDTLVGGAGDDRLTGGRGSDRFAFTASDGGADSVYGFESFDTLQLAGFGLLTPAAALSVMGQFGADVVFSYAGGSITFVDTQLSRFQALPAQGWLLS